MSKMGRSDLFAPAASAASCSPVQRSDHEGRASWQLVPSGLTVSNKPNCDLHYRHDDGDASGSQGRDGDGGWNLRRGLVRRRLANIVCMLGPASPAR